MTTTAVENQLPEIVRNALADRPEVRPFPEAVTQLLAASQNVDATPAEFERIIERDPALAVRLLKVANSSSFARPQPADSIRQAVITIGIRGLRSLALAAAGAQMFAKGDRAHADRQALWTHSLGVASVAQVLAKYIPTVSDEDAFMAGIFHDVGKLLLFDIIPSQYQVIHSRLSGVKLSQAEAKILENTHADIGMQSAHSWGVSDALKMAIGFHHHPDKAGIEQELVGVVHLADHLANTWDLGSQGRASGLEVPQWSDGIMLDDKVLIMMEEHARAAYEETLEVMSL